MKNTKHSAIGNGRRNLFTFFITLIMVVGFVAVSWAQPRFTRTTFNAAYTPITIGGGATSSIVTGNDNNQTGIPIGFSFGYGDSTFTTVGLNTNGLVWFDAIEPNSDANKLNLVETSSPNQALSAWCNDLMDDASSDILYQTQGAPGSRTFTVQYTNYPTYNSGVEATNVRINCQIILYEGTNVIEFRYGSEAIIGSQNTYAGAFIGLEWGTGGNENFIDAVTGSSMVSNRMLSAVTDWPTYNFRFTPGVPSAISAGTYNVGVGQTYNSLTQAVADVNHRGINGAVTLNLTDAQYDTTAANGSNIFPIFVATPNGSLTNLLTISKTGTPATLAWRGSSIAYPGEGYGTGVSSNAISHTDVPLMGVCASYTTISNLNLVTHGTMPHQVEIGLAQFELFGAVGAQHNLYDKISIDLDRSQGQCYGIYSFSTSSPGGFPGSNSYNTWRDISIKDCNYGMQLSAPNDGTGPADEGNQIITSSCNIFNYIGDPNTSDDIISDGSFGVYLNGQHNVVVRNCIIQNITSTTTTGDVDGINVWNSYGNIEISNNIIRNLRRDNAGLNSFHLVSGIRINNSNDITIASIFNNSISNLLTSYIGAPTDLAAIIGINFQFTGNFSSEVYNNSISLDGSSFADASSVCLSIDYPSETFQIKNNVFANYTTGQTGVAFHSIWYTNSADHYGNSSSLSDYNVYHIADATNGYIGKATTSFYSSLAAWQAAMLNPGTDANSQVADPHFVNPATDLHASNQSAVLNGTGTLPPSYILTDIDCESRTAPHDIGFDQLTFFTYYADSDNDSYGDLTNTISVINSTPPAGYVTDSTDCNDGNASINPGATELCNGIDDNCDGQIDEGCNTTTWYADNDADNYGDITNSTVSQTQPVGYVADSTDCNDNNAAINPGATELCNGIDDNCDGQIDEGCNTTTWYADNDGDNYGDISNSTVSQTQPVGYVADSTDCNDNNAAINPGATEVCGNGIDDNCNGQIDENNASVADAGTDNAVCLANSTTLSAVAPLVGTGTWSIVQGVAGTGNIAQPNNPNTSFSGIYNHPYLLEWTVSNGGCSSSDTVSIVFVSASYSTGRIQGISGAPNALCGATQTYEAVPNMKYATYTWSGYPAGTVVNSQSGNMINLTFPSSGFNNFQLMVQSEVCGFISPVRAVILKGAPSLKTVNGTAVVCPNATGISYDVPLYAGVTYNWIVPAGATITSGQGTNAITVDWGATGGRVLCFMSNNCGNCTASITVSTNCRMAQSSAQNERLNSISVYPNPSEGIYQIDFAQESINGLMEVTDMQGRIILQQRIFGANQTIDITGFNNGIYLLRIHTQEINQVFKLIKE
ncbi:MAG: Protein metal binding site [Bacteroidetes bacterium ADurb.Bin141]|nr:MAG: Protein metal binding site [Bacteroidetes bacterium ADurb.Bin141]